MGVIHTAENTSGTATGSTAELSGHGGTLVVQSDQTAYFTLDGTTAVSSVNSIMIDVSTGPNTPVVLSIPPELYKMYWIATASGVLIKTEIW